MRAVYESASSRFARFLPRSPLLPLLPGVSFILPLPIIVIVIYAFTLCVHALPSHRCAYFENHCLFISAARSVLRGIRLPHFASASPDRVCVLSPIALALRVRPIAEPPPPSRAHDAHPAHSDFLIYFENIKKKEKGVDRDGARARSVRFRCASPVVTLTTPTRSLENQVLRDGERDMYIKQTYSVLRNDVNQEEGPASGSTPSGSGGPANEKKDVKKKPRKWHLSECPFPMHCFV